MTGFSVGKAVLCGVWREPKQHKTLAGCGAIVAIMALMLVCPRPAPGLWDIQTVISTDDAGAYSSIALNASDQPRIAFYDATAKDLRYAAWNGSAWTFTTVDSGGNVGRYCSLALDSRDIPHIAYHDATNKTLKYAYYVPRDNTWTLQTVDTGDTGYWASLALDSQNRPHIAYYAQGATGVLSRIRHAYKDKDWTLQNVHTYDVPAKSCSGISLVLDLLGKPCVAFQSHSSNSDSQLMYATKPSTVWYAETVMEENLNTSAVGMNCSLALDTNGRPGIAHVTVSDLVGSSLYEITYSHWSGSVWTNSSIAYAYPDCASLQYNSLGFPAVVHRQNSKTLCITRRGLMGWTTSTIDTLGTGDLGVRASMQLDSRGNVHASYYDQTNTDLKYAFSHSAPTLSWTGETGYTTDGVNPDSAPNNFTFHFRVNYRDLDNHSPKEGYPRVHIYSDGTEIAGSPFTMTLVSGDFASGALYSFPKLLAPGSHYTYSFEAQDILGVPATGTPTEEQAGPTVTNTAPVLSWTGAPNYESDGVHPDEGIVNATSFCYRVLYTDAEDNPSKMGYPKLHVLFNGSDLPGSPFTMSFESGQFYSTGVIYSRCLSLPNLSGEYTYVIKVYDEWGEEGTPELFGTGPVVLPQPTLPPSLFLVK
jgi:hypothetical protein